jgi:hypothetical protein
MFRNSHGTGEFGAKVYWIIVKVLSCAFLACMGNVIKTLLAKLFSTHFYQASYFTKMEEALTKVSTFLLPLLSAVSPDGLLRSRCSFQVLFLPCCWGSAPKLGYSMGQFSKIATSRIEAASFPCLLIPWQGWKVQLALLVFELLHCCRKNASAKAKL